MADKTPEQPPIPDLGGKPSPAWENLIQEIGAQHPTTSPKADELKARLQVWLHLSNLRFRQQYANAELSHTKTMVTWTKVLAAATIVLALSTIALLVVTLNS